MADIIANSEYFTVTGALTGRYILGNAHWESVSTISVVLEADTPVGVVAVVEARAYNAISAATWYPWIYRSAYLNGAAVATYALSVANVTTNSILHIPASGLQIALNITGHTSGTLTFYVKRMLGAASY